MILTESWLNSRLFAFRAGPQLVTLADRFRFEPNHRISGYRHPNETGWKIEDNQLVILRADSEVSCVASPAKNDDGTVSLIGTFLLAPGDHIHRFDEISDELEERKIVFTFDLFDTLIARRCFSPIDIFRRVEAKSGISEFAQYRQRLEHRLFEKGDYTFDDIYEELQNELGLSSTTKLVLQIIELAEEWDNLFPITEVVKRVLPGDLVVTDMYLPHPFVSRLVHEKLGLPGRAIHQTNHGKHHGTVWAPIQASHRVGRHHGDNSWGDIEVARRSGMDVEHIKISEWSRGEKILVEAGLPDFAGAVREARLRSFHPDPQIHLAQLAQFDVNLPVLLLSSLITMQRARERGVDTLLMCSRDCNLWVMLMRWMVGIWSSPLRVEYLTSSRVLFLSDSPEYAAYFLRMRGQRSMIVDVSGTGRSPSYFLAKLSAQEHTSIFLVASTRYVAGWVASLAPHQEDVEMGYVTEQSFERRFAIEMLNMCLEGRAQRVTFNGQNLNVQYESNEFGSRSRQIISFMRSGFLSVMRNLRRSEITKIQEDLPSENLHQAVESCINLIEYYWGALTPIRSDIDQQEAYIAAVARAERERNATSQPRI